MPSSSQWIAFLIASILFIQVPGPSLLFTIGRALTVGRREALLSVVGNGVGLITQVVLVALGLGAIVAQSAAAYTVIKVAGASYVVWLGISAIRDRRSAREAMAADAAAVGAIDAAVEPARGKPWQAMRIGFIVGITNPKTVLFFIAFLPQFVNSRAGHASLQMIVLGVVFGVMAVCSDSIWAILAGKAREWFAREPRRLDRLGATGGAMMVGLGVTMLARE